MPVKRSLEQRFWRKVSVDPDGCWLWTGSVEEKGYGQIRRGARGAGILRAHRLSWELAYGEIPHGLMVLHNCDTPACVRPDHLFLGTAKDNSLDMAVKQRWRNQSTRLTDTDVLEIRRRRSTGEQLKAIAADYGIRPQAVCNISKGRNWRHLPLTPDSGVDKRRSTAGGDRQER